jgi:hypothetical protein
MLTDLHLQKYLDGELSEEDEKELEARLEKDPDLKARLEALENQSQVVGQHAWQRYRKGRHARRGSRTRYTTMLPALLFLIVVLMVARHWFVRPGENSTFTLSGGNGNAVELLYDAPTGWRYLDKEYAAGDSLTFSVRDTGSYHIAVAAVFGDGAEAEVAFAHMTRKRKSPCLSLLRGRRREPRRPGSLYFTTTRRCRNCRPLAFWISCPPQTASAEDSSSTTKSFPLAADHKPLVKSAAERARRF